jgi:hypothetical protein
LKLSPKKHKDKRADSEVKSGEEDDLSGSQTLAKKDSDSQLKVSFSFVIFSFLSTSF